jgi:hypothetical protein
MVLGIFVFYFRGICVGLARMEVSIWVWVSGLAVLGRFEVS